MNAILMPVFALVLVTFIVWIQLYRKKTPTASDNLQTLFELPVLFYVLCPLLYVTGYTDAGYVYMAWIFVGGRLVHSIIHLSYNKVNHRFIVYLISSLVLWGMWGRFFVQILMK